MELFEDYITNPSFIEAYGFNNKWLLYVEDESDIPFWDAIINHIFPEKYDIKPAVTGSENKRGKSHLEKLIDKLNEHFLIAIDSDFDFVCQNGRLPHSYNINSIKYILQTYTYSRESLQYSPKNIKDVMRRTKYTISSNIDITKIINIFSDISFEILINFLYLKEKNIEIIVDNKKFTESSLVKLIRLPNKCKITDFNFNINEVFFNQHKQKVCIVENKLDALITDKSDYTAFKKSLLDKGINISNAFLFISGHLYEDFIHQIFEHVIRILLDKEIKRLKSETHGTDLSDKILKLKTHFREYCSYKTMIYQKSIDPSDFYIQKIYEDVNKVIST